MPRRALRDVVVLIPGILGSVLRRNGKDVWALSGWAALNALLSLGSSITDLAVKDDPPDADDLGDGVTVGPLMPDAHLIPGLWKIDGYTKIRDTIHREFDVTDGRNYFEFPYDWRRDNRVAARKLSVLSREWLA